MNTLFRLVFVSIVLVNLESAAGVECPVDGGCCDPAFGDLNWATTIHSGSSCSDFAFSTTPSGTVEVTFANDKQCGGSSGCSLRQYGSTTAVATLAEPADIDIIGFAHGENAYETMSVQILNSGGGTVASATVTVTGGITGGCTMAESWITPIEVSLAAGTYTLSVTADTKDGLYHNDAHLFASFTLKPPQSCGTCTCGVETLAAAAVAAPAGGASGDPHLALPHGGRADFRGEHKALYNFLSSPNLNVNVMTELADFELYPASSSRHKEVHGSFITQSHIVARTRTGKMVRASFWASEINENNYAWVNYTVDDSIVMRMKAKNSQVIEDVTLETGFSSLHVKTPEYEVVVTPNKFQSLSWERNVVGLHHQLDVQFKLRVPEDKLKVAPHGIVGQGWDGDGKAIDGEMDVYPQAGEFTTYAMAKGAIEGVPKDYMVDKPYSTTFKYSRFDATSATPRDVAALVAAGELNTPKAVAKADADGFVGSTEYNFTDH